MPSYKLYYFMGRGNAEICRLLFAAGGVEYEDVRYTREDWPKHKEEMPLKAMPVLEIDGKKFCQTDAMARYLARQFGLYGDNDLEAFRIDEICETLAELKQSFVKIWYAQDSEKADLIKTTVEDVCPKFFTFLQRRLCENGDGDGFLVGKKLSLADVAVFNAVSTYNGVLKMFKYSENPNIVEKVSKLQALCVKVESEPKIAEWLKKRPDTDM